MPDHQTLYSPLSAVIRRQPVVVPPTASIDQALRIMNEAKVGSLVVTDPESGRPLGIFTLRDLLKRVALASCDREQLITTVMSGARLVSLVGQATAYQAALAMAQHRLRHILVVDATGRLIGVVSQNDLYALQRVGISEISDQAIAVIPTSSNPERAKPFFMRTATCRSSFAPRACEISGVTPRNTPSPNSMITI